MYWPGVTPTTCSKRRRKWKGLTAASAASVIQRQPRSLLRLDSPQRCRDSPLVPGVGGRRETEALRERAQTPPANRSASSLELLRLAAALFPQCLGSRKHGKYRGNRRQPWRRQRQALAPGSRQRPNRRPPARNETPGIGRHGCADARIRSRRPRCRAAMIPASSAPSLGRCDNGRCRP